MFSLSKKRFGYLLPLLVLILCPPSAWANAGTPLMWASVLHLVLGNAIIGVIEGLLLAWMFKCSKGLSILILIAANYASAWVGLRLITGYVMSLPDITIETIRFWFQGLVVIAFVVTLIIEFPFFWWALRLRAKEHVWRRALIATPVIHCISYILLFGWYWMSSGTSMMSQLKVVAVEEMLMDEPYDLYFLPREGDQLLRLNLPGRNPAQSIAAMTARHRNDRLFARAREGTGFDLFVHLDSEDRKARTEARILEDFAEKAPIDGFAWRDQSTEKGTWQNHGDVPNIGSESDWQFRTGSWPVQGLIGLNVKTEERLRYSLEIPYIAWQVRNATQITGDYIVAQLGEDQICLIHPESRRIALITRGKGPLVAKPKASRKTEEDEESSGPSR